MSNALAVAHVTQALALLIESNLRPEIDMAVSVETRKPPAEPPTEPTITVFLYQVTHNPTMRNHDLPTRASDGTLVNRAVAALDLHYVISAYGEESELVGQRLIGCVARVMREFPVLPADVIEEAGERPYLAGSDLAAAQQKVRFTPLQMDVDETSKLWGMLHQTPYSLSVTYQASLVLVEGREKPERSRPVRRTQVTVGARGPVGGADSADSGGSSPVAGRSSAGGSSAGGSFAGGTSAGGRASGVRGAGAPGVSVADGSGTDGDGRGKDGDDRADDGADNRAADGDPGRGAAGKRPARGSSARKATSAGAKTTSAKATSAKATSAKAAAKKGTTAKKAAAETAGQKRAAKKTSGARTGAKKSAGTAGTRQGRTPSRGPAGTPDGEEG